ncbi:MAG: hypothetical protein AB7U81_08600 [Thiohalomonadaceae bacterium]
MALYIAPHGWDHPGWVGEFYPDDLPPAWRLAYFFNEFDAVVVPAAIWAEAPDPAAWCEDSPPSARFFIELPGPGADGAPLLIAAERLGPRLAGFIAAPGLGPADLAGWRARLPRGVPGPEGLTVEVHEGAAPDLRALRERMAALARRGDALLVFTGNPPSLAALRAARTLAQLLGLPS